MFIVIFQGERGQTGAKGCQVWTLSSNRLTDVPYSTYNNCSLDEVALLTAENVCAHSTERQVNMIILKLASQIV